ncbi:MAG: sel1 repeat family protein [Cupriavidus sp.]|nr:sel1 repeat family protein [Cupriavidus sp.]
MTRKVAATLLLMVAACLVIVAMIRPRGGQAAATPTPPGSEGISNPVAEQPRPDRPSSTEAVAGQTPPLRKFAVQRLQGRAYSAAQNFQPRPGDANQVISALLPLAEAGDEVAAYEIYLKVASCQYQLQSAMASAPNTDPMALIPAECQSLPVNQWRNYSSRWLEASAERGFVPAQLTYAGDPGAVVGSETDMISAPERVETYRKNAMRYLHQAAATGNVEALQRLASAYGNGVLTKRDPIRALAYFLASDTASRPLIPPEISEALKDKYSTGLSTKDIQRATQQGSIIYEDCCSP